MRKVNPKAKTLGDHVPVVAIDLDSTFAMNEKLPMIDRKLNKDIVRVMGKYCAMGYTVIIYTSRDISRKRETINWLNRNNVYCYDDIVFNKLKYDILIDDKVVNTNCIDFSDFDGGLSFDECDGIYSPMLKCNKCFCPTKRRNDE